MEYKLHFDLRFSINPQLQRAFAIRKRGKRQTRPGQLLIQSSGCEVDLTSENLQIIKLSAVYELDLKIFKAVANEQLRKMEMKRKFKVCWSS